MKRTTLRERLLPPYTKGEELFNTISHIVGGGFGILALVVCVVFSALYRDVWSVVSSCIYGGSMVLLYTVSSVYHGLHPSLGKKVMQVIDHCTIYLLIGGTYTPVALCAIRPYSSGWGWVIFGIVWGCAVIGATFTAIDLKKYAKLSMACYIGMGWSVLLAVKPTVNSVEPMGLLWLLLGGISYTVGAVIYGLGKKHRYMHAVFHLFVLLGSMLQFISVLFYIL